MQGGFHVQASQKRPRDPQLAGLMSEEALRDQPRGLRIVRTCVHAHARSATHSSAHMRTHTHICTPIHTHPHMCSYAHIHTYMHTPDVCMHMFTYPHIHVHTCTHSRTHWHAQSPHECKSTRVDIHRHGHLHTCSTYTHTRVYRHKCTRFRTCGPHTCIPRMCTYVCTQTWISHRQIHPDSHTQSKHTYVICF